MENYQQEILIWALLSLLGGVGVATVLYYKVVRWHSSVRWILAVLRATAFGGILFLLFAPVFEHNRWRKDTPTFLVVLDNSQSMSCCLDSIALQKKLEQLQRGLHQWSKEKEVALHWYTLDPTKSYPQTFSFSEPQSNLKELLQRAITTQEGNPISGVLLISDGLYNKGASPEQMSLPAPLYVLGVGDTLPRQDVVLEKLFYNKVTYQGTRMSIEAIVSHYGYNGTKVRIQLRDNRQKYSQETTTTYKWSCHSSLRTTYS